MLFSLCHYRYYINVVYKGYAIINIKEAIMPSRCINIEKFDDPKSFRKIINVISSGQPEVKFSAVKFYAEKKDD
jgi:hypothetical protein